MTHKPAPLDHIAPYPRTKDEATAAALIRHNAAFGEMHNHLTEHFPNGPEWRKSVERVVSSFVETYLLIEIRDLVSREAADEVARELWTALECGDLPPRLWRVVEEEGLSHHEIAAAADRVAESIRAKAEGNAR